MFDISAFLSLKPAVPGIDVAPAQGMETADIQAFGNILADQVIDQAGAQPPGAALALPAAAGLPVAGKLPEGGKILPDLLPGAETAPPQALAVNPAVTPVVPQGIAVPTEIPIPVRNLAIETPKVAPDAQTVPGKAPAQIAEMPKAEALSKMLAEGQALKAALADAKPATVQVTGKRHGEAKAAAASLKNEPAETAIDSAALTAVQLPTLPVEAALPAPIGLPLPQLAAQPQAPDVEYTPEQPASGGQSSAQPQPAAAPSVVATSVVALAGSQVLLQAKPAAPAPVAELAPLPTIEPAQATDETAATPIALLPAQAAAVAAAPAGTNRFRVAPGGAKSQGQAPAKAQAETPAANTTPAAAKPAAPQGPVDQPQGEAQPAAARPVVAAAERERPAAPILQHQATVIADTAQALTQGTTVPSAVQASATPQAGHDFVKLVDRLIEARDAAASQSVPQVISAAIKHAEFGQVSLHFQQDAGGLSVSMTSPDPDFKPAVQAAMPADRGGMTGDQGQSQNQAQNQSPYQSAGSNVSSQAQDQRGAGSNDQARTAQQREGRPSANPSQAGREEAKGDRRSGIFA